ncbi:MAG: aminotransferase class I/II-fold pyridoxal phosphate-dependent enzyme [Chloroflexi bacterium]|nr:aminotransferase class I/II-fold pyridoxal phosphate-dependent enzyme [Chloroflexota bacterium]MBM4453391.1 aminotransferase class I/II-fold pyridoxal phosphate-dependent enzyme [Chloroflexota bacterium]
MEGVISLGVGEPDFVTPWHIREAAIYSLEKGYTMYTSNSGMPELRQALSEHLSARYGLNYDPVTEILITVGVSEGLDLALRAILDPGDEVIMPDPCYVAYPACTALAGGVAVRVPLFEENSFAITARDIEARITPRTKAILLGYPANPTGAVLPKEELVRIAELAKRHDLLVISDEVYDRLVYGVEHTCMASLPGMRKRTILLNGFSKAYAMTGWRVGYAASDPEIIKFMTRVHQYTMLCGPIMGQMAAIEALKGGNEEVEAMLREYDQRRRVMVQGFRNIGLSCFEPKGAFYAFPSIKGTGLSSEDFAEKLLREEKVAVVPGTAFGECGEGYIRCCYAASMAEIEEALKRMGRFIKKHRRV